MTCQETTHAAIRILSRTGSGRKGVGVGRDGLRFPGMQLEGLSLVAVGVSHPHHLSILDCRHSFNNLQKGLGVCSYGVYILVNSRSNPGCGRCNTALLQCAYLHCFKTPYQPILLQVRTNWGSVQSLIAVYQLPGIFSCCQT